VAAKLGTYDQIPCEYRSKTTPNRHPDEKLRHDNLSSREPPRHAGPIANVLVGDLGVQDAQRIAGMSSGWQTESARATRDRVARTPASRVKSLAGSEISLSDSGECIRSRAEMGFVLV
jgi:hypothetical protein